MKKYCWLPVIALTVMMATACSGTKKTTSAQMSFAPNIVVAHRGAWKKNNLPENSIASLQEAIRLGCTGSEFDVHMTVDDSLVVNHDPHYAGKIIDKSTYGELLEHKLSNGENIPTLREYLLAGMQQTNAGKTMLVVEIKPAFSDSKRGAYVAEKTVQLVKELKAAPWVMYISFDYNIVKKVMELQPDAKVAYLNGEKSPSVIKQDGVWGIDYNASVFKKNPAWIAEAKKEKVNLNVWTVNTEEDMKWFIENKFDYITTNEPELLFELTK
ncbi:MAG: glycerophosphodiester phosphodiesterase family protein [Agriterribacter sp.]